MKSKRQMHEKDSHPSAIPQKAKVVTLSNNCLTRRKDHSHNKENIIQITQPLDPNPNSYHSKQFILSRDSLSKNSRSNLKEIHKNQKIIMAQNSKQLAKYHQKQKEQQLFDRRLSLKCTTNYSQQLDTQKSHRLSMAPLRRESASSNVMPLQSMIDQRESMFSYYPHSVSISDSKPKQDFKRQTIITNLMGKLQHQQDLRSIIESKLKTNTSSTQSFIKERKNQSYITDFTQESNLASKLRQCENEIKYFKSIVKEMSEKMIQMGEEKKFTKQKQKSWDDQNKNQQLDIMSFLKKISLPQCQNCQKQPPKQRITKDVAIQTSYGQCQTSTTGKFNQSFDFLENLQKTIKVLDGKKA